MKTIAASSYSNTAPLIWSFLYGTQRGRYEVVLDNAPARSAQLLAENSVDAALVPVIAAQFIKDVKIIPDVCVGARERVRSVCLFTKDVPLEDVRSVALDKSSKTSVILTKIIFREFLGFEPKWVDARPDIDAMLKEHDCALLIGDPALAIADSVSRNANSESPITNYQSFDLVKLWQKYTGFGFVFAMWMTRKVDCDIDFAGARDEGLEHLDKIIAGYKGEIPISRDEFETYLTENISFSISESMQKGMNLYFELAESQGLIEQQLSLNYL